MEICQKLVGHVKHELNHIYTEPPFQTSSGADMGWFCREHALQTSCFLSCLGYSVDICVGDVTVRVPGDLVITTFGTGSDHVWCRTKSAVPIDTSLTLKYFDVTCPDLSLVCNSCDDCHAGFKVLYAENASDEIYAATLIGDEKIISYNEKSIVDKSIRELLEEPYSFLNPPPIGSRSFSDIYGDHVFYAITAHLIKLFKGEVKPLYNNRDADSAVRTIVKWNPEAKQEILFKGL